MNIEPEIRKTADGAKLPPADRFHASLATNRPVSLAGSERQLYPCSPEQRQHWLSHRDDSHAAWQNIAVRWPLEGTINHTELESVFELLVSRHQVLRTGFVDHDGEAVQIVEPCHPFQIPLVDLTGMSVADAYAGAENSAYRQAHAPFDLSTPPLIRVMHMRLPQDVSLLVVTVHCLVSDAGSMDILARELSEGLTALHDGRTPALPPLPISYGDYSVTQADRYASNRQVAREYWSQTLDGVKYFEVQSDYPRSPDRAGNLASHSIPLGRELTGDLVNLAYRHGCTLNIAGLAAVLALLHRYTGETDIAIGCEYSGRGEPIFENLVGPVSHDLLLRTDLSGNPSFVELMERIRSGVAAGHAHCVGATEGLTGNVRADRTMDRSPPCSVRYTFRRTCYENNCATRLTPVEMLSCPVTATCDLNFSLIEGSNGWTLLCEFNAGVFDSKTIMRMLNHLSTLLYAVTVDPAQRVTSLPVLGDAERHALVIGNNRTGALYPRHLTVTQLFGEQARRTPEAIAVVCGEARLSYRELDQASNRLAQELRGRGIETGNRVAVLLGRSPDVLVAILAILKSGNAYIPLDPVYPDERLRHVMEGARPAAIITQSAFRERVETGTLPTILLDSESHAIAAQSAEPLTTAPDPDAIAYIIHTSGSTGRPKGVMIRHRALVNLLCSMQHQPGLARDDTVLSVTTVAFDMVVPDLFLPLIVGARLVLATEQEKTDGSALRLLLQRHNVTFMQATPATWQLLLEAGWQGQSPLKMLCGGEALPRKLAERLLQYSGELWNMYGPTETTVWSSAHRVQSGSGPVLLGPPIGNTQFYILDNNQELMPEGAPGELYIGGDGVALGYFDQPDMTREKFVPDKFSKRPGAKLYRTGDRVRMKQQGCLEYLGRTDHQVKLRGFRVELGEIETVLLQQPDTAEAVAVLGQNPSGEPAIWAYVVERGVQAEPPESRISALRASLVRSLPAYMCPSSIVLLEAMPRTPNGKVDRQALPAPAQGQRGGMTPGQPLNDIERRLAALWCAVLGVESVSKTADFFELGGHSLLAARLLARIEAEFGLRIALLTLFEAPTIEAQARLLMDTTQREYDFRQVVQLQPEGTKPLLIAIHNTGVYFYNLSRRLGTDQPFMALQLFDPSIERTSFPHSLEEVAAEYAQLIVKFQSSGPYRLIGWCVGGVLAFEVARQLVAAGHAVPLLVMIDAWAPGHNQRLSRVRAMLADYSFRWQLIRADWQRLVAHEQTLGSFLAHRTLSKRLLRWLGHPQDAASAHVTFEARAASAENYDQWLLGYLEEMAKRYEPKPYAGRVTLLCSAREPKGLFLDPRMGWDAFALDGVDVAVIDGDHFTVFKGQGLGQMAMHISAMSSIHDAQSNRHTPPA